MYAAEVWRRATYPVPPQSSSKKRARSKRRQFVFWSENDTRRRFRLLKIFRTITGSTYTIRSSDLGRYDTNGAVECVGGTYNWIEIRGFRVGLGETNTHLAAHPGVREDVTLVRRDKDEEKLLVGYRDPVNSWKDDESAVDGHLGKKAECRVVLGDTRL